jgi:Fe-S-cluster containining protein
VLSSSTLAAAVQSGGCPFQVKNLCGIHAIKPLGCRVYFCDRSAQRWQEELSEAMLERVRSLHNRHGVEYRYGEWRQMLSAFA